VAAEITPPSGTVTFLFTDIEGSTRLWESDPVAMRESLERHDDILRSAIESRGGYVFSTAGDAFCAAFHTPAEALDAALEAQWSLGDSGPSGVGLLVRMGAHVGVAQERGGDYFGSVVNRAARLMGLAHGGQVLVSSAVEELVRDGLPEGVGLRSLGEHALRGLSRPESVFQLVAEGLRADFGPLAAAGLGNLPSPATSFVGRVGELSALGDVVGAKPLVTLLGPGGVGKTRLAIEAAAGAADEFGDGVWFVELAPVSDRDAAVHAVASTLSVSTGGESSLLDAIVDAIADRRMLLVLDNCEHVIDAAREVAGALVGGGRGVSVLATSREPLGVAGEQVWPVEPLDAELEAAELFVERALAANPSFTLGDGDREALVELCAQLDGIPLAVELAASRARSMAIGDLARRVEDRFRLLRSGRRQGGDTDDRQATLIATVEWSYRLLEPREQELFDRLSVFAGGFDLTAAEHVCSDDAIDELDVADLIEALVDRSMVQAAHTQTGVRFGLLETLRQFGDDRLRSSDADGPVHQRHALFFADQAVAQWDQWDGPDQHLALEWSDTELANLRAAFRWATDHDDLPATAAIAAHTTLMCWPMQLFEASEWTETLLANHDLSGVRYLPRLYAAAAMCMYAGRPYDAIDYAQRARELNAEDHYDGLEPRWYDALEIAAQRYVGNLDRVLDMEHALADQPGHAGTMGLSALLYDLPSAGRNTEAHTIADRALEGARLYGNPFWYAFTLNSYGRVFMESDPHRALSALRDGLAYTRAHRLHHFEARIAGEVARLEGDVGDVSAALELFATALTSLHNARNLVNLAATMGDLVVLLERLGQPQAAATLHGAVAKEGGMVRVLGLPATLQQLESELGTERFHYHQRAGAEMTLAEAVEYAQQQIHSLT